MQRRLGIRNKNFEDQLFRGYLNQIRENFLGSDNKDKLKLFRSLDLLVQRGEGNEKFVGKNKKEKGIKYGVYNGEIVRDIRETLKISITGLCKHLKLDYGNAKRAIISAERGEVTINFDTKSKVYRIYLTWLAQQGYNPFGMDIRI